MVKDQAARAKRSVEKTGQCAKEEGSSSLLGKRLLCHFCYIPCSQSMNTHNNNVHNILYIFTHDNYDYTEIGSVSIKK